MQKTILIVDDSADIRYTIREGLKNIAMDYHFLEASNGRECVTLLEKGEQPDLILLDIMMPEMDGWDVSAKLCQHEHWRQIPIIFLTAKTDFVTKNLGEVIGKDFIEKPFDVIDLKKHIEKALKENNKNRLLPPN